MTRRLFRGAIFCLLLYWLLIGTLTHLPATELPHVRVNDKLEHFAAFALLGFLLNAVLHQITRRHHPVPRFLPQVPQRADYQIAI